MDVSSCHLPLETLRLINTNYATVIIGRVIDGMDTLDAMEKAPVDAKNRPLKEIVIKSVTMHANPIADM